MPALTLLNPGPLANFDGDAVGFQLAATDTTPHALKFLLADVPPGVTVNAITGFVSGSIDDGDDSASPYVVIATVQDTVTHQTAVQTFNWAIALPSVTLTSPGDQSGYDGDLVSLAVSASDTASHALTYSASGLPSGLSIDSSSGVISGAVASDADADSPYSVTVTATDAGGVSASQTFNWAIAQAAISLTSPGDQSNYDGDAVSLSVSASENAGHALTFSASGLPSGLSINSSSGVISGAVASNADADSPYSVTVTATDSAADVSASQRFNWAVSPAYLNLIEGDQSNVAGQSVSVAVYATSVPNQTVSYSASGLPSGLGIDSSTGTISGTIAYGAEGDSPYSVVITGTDSAGNVTASADFTWTVTAPAVELLNPGSLQSVDGASIDVPTAAFSTDGAALTYSAAGLPPGLSIDGGSGVISGAIAGGADVDSPYAVAVTVTDGAAGLSETADFTWAVSSLTLNDPGRQSNLAGATVSLSLAASYDGIGTLAYSAAGLPAGLSIDSATGLISGTIAGGAYASSPYSVTVGVSDGVSSASVTFAWSVEQLIVAKTPTQLGYDGEPISLSQAVTAPAGHTVSFTASGLPAGLSINASTGAISGTLACDADASSPYTVAVTAADATAGVEVTREFQWNVDNRTQPPESYAPLPALPGETARAYLFRELAHAQAALAAAQETASFFQFVANDAAARMARIMAAEPSTWMLNGEYYIHVRELRVAMIQYSYWQARVNSLEAFIPIVVALLEADGISFA